MGAGGDGSLGAVAEVETWTDLTVKTSVADSSGPALGLLIRRAIYVLPTFRPNRRRIAAQARLSFQKLLHQFARGQRGAHLVGLHRLAGTGRNRLSRVSSAIPPAS
jgi:hypothetical protein